MSAPQQEPLWVDLPGVASSRYPIFVGRGLLAGMSQRISQVGKAGEKLFVVTDENVEGLWLSRMELEDSVDVITLPSGEDHKDLDQVQRVWDTLESRGADRHSLVLNLGGGVVGDLGGFAAATYLRGIDFAQVPTTLLSQVDASVGGKVGVNWKHLKNRVGVFAQPRFVLCDVDALSTLSVREFRSGLAEVVKHGAVGDAKALRGWEFSTLSHSSDAILEMVRHSCAFKAAVVHEDARESGARKKLNFGHTVGHALEALALERGESLLHGEAVAIGMVVAAQLSCKVCGLRSEEADELSATIHSAQLPVHVPDWADTAEIVRRTRTDKKRSGGSIEWSLLTELGACVYEQRVEESLVCSAIDLCRS